MPGESPQAVGLQGVIRDAPALPEGRHQEAPSEGGRVGRGQGPPGGGKCRAKPDRLSRRAAVASSHLHRERDTRGTEASIMA